MELKQKARLNTQQKIQERLACMQIFLMLLILVQI